MFEQYLQLYFRITPGECLDFAGLLIKTTRRVSSSILNLCFHYLSSEPIIFNIPMARYYLFVAIPEFISVEVGKFMNSILI